MDIDYSHGGDIYTYINKTGKKPLDYSANINPLGIPNSIKEAIVKGVEDFDVYPDPRCMELGKEVSYFEGVEPKDIVFGNGAADIIFRLVNVLRPKSALVMAPTFSEYEDALKTVGTNITRYKLRAENNFDPQEDILDYIPKVDIVFICSPNNPTGRIFPKALLSKLMKKCQLENTYLVVDNCFLDFALEAKENSVNGYIKSYDNLMIIKAFTKTYACAGIRLGYLITANEKIKHFMHSNSQPWSVSTPAQLAGIAACKDKAYLKRGIEIIEEERIYLTSELKSLGFRVFEGKANYIFFYSKNFNLDKSLEEKGILIRNCSNYYALEEGYYRICIKKRKENEILIRKIKECN